MPAIPGAINIPTLNGDEIVAIAALGPMSAQTTTGAIAALATGGGAGGRVVTASKSSNYTVLPTDVGTYFDNGGALGSVIFVLPSPAAGLNYNFSVVVQQTLEVDVPGGVTISLGTVNSVSGGKISAGLPFSSIFVYAPSGVGNQWIAISQTGGWSVT
jgi:hypothetical protein